VPNNNELFNRVSKAVESRGGNIANVLTDDQLVADLADRIVGAQSDTYSLTIDYTKSVEQMLADGGYDYKNPDITSHHFRHEATGKVVVVAQLVHFDRFTSTDDALKELSKRGLRPATMAELLAFGSKYPDVQRQFPVVALGSVWANRSGDRYVGSLSGDASGRYVGRDWFGGGWHSRCRFLAVRK
jgi:hypothetical protein